MYIVNWRKIHQNVSNLNLVMPHRMVQEPPVIVWPCNTINKCCMPHPPRKGKSSYYDTKVTLKYNIDPAWSTCYAWPESRL